MNKRSSTRRGNGLSTCSSVQSLEPRVLMCIDQPFGIPWASDFGTSIHPVSSGGHWTVGLSGDRINLHRSDGTSQQWKLSDLLPGYTLASSKAAVTPAGALWLAVSSTSGAALAQLSPSGEITANALVVPAPGPDLPQIMPRFSSWSASISFASDASGGVWYADGAGEVIHLTAAGTLQRFAHADYHSIFELAPAADGGVWFVGRGEDFDKGAIGTISSAGELSYLTRSLDLVPTEIALGPSATLYFASGTQFGWQDAAGQFHAIPAGQQISELVVSPAGRPWLLDSGTSRNPLVQITDSFTAVHFTPTAASGVIRAIAIDASGNLLHLPSASDQVQTFRLDYDLLGISTRLTQRHNEPFTALVGSFIDPLGGTDLSAYSATIRFDQRDPVAATITANATGGFDLTAASTLPAGGYTITITVTDSRSDTPRTLTFTSALTVVAPAIAGIAEAVEAKAGQLFSGVVARYVGISEDLLSQYQATIQWGDGLTSTGELVLIGNNTVAIRASHIFAKPGFPNFTVQLSRVVPLVPLYVVSPFDAGSGSVRTYDDVYLWAPSPSTTAFGRATVVAGQMIGDVVRDSDIPSRLQGTIASFTLTDSADQPSRYRATIDLGEPGRAPAEGIIVPRADGSFDVHGNFAFATTGWHNVTVTVYRAGTTEVVGIARASVKVGEAMAGWVESFSVMAGTEFYRKVGFIRSHDSETLWSDITGTINWGDGLSSEAMIIPGHEPGTWDIYGRHTYADVDYPQGYSPTIRIQATRSISITGAPVERLSFATTVSPGPWSDGVQVEPALFSGFRILPYRDWTSSGELSTSIRVFLGNASMNVSGILGQITWADGEVTELRLAYRDGRLVNLSGSRSFANAGEHIGTVSVTLGDQTRSMDIVVWSYKPQAPVTPLAEVVANPISATKGVEFSGVLGRFRLNRPADAETLIASISWGDGRWSQGTITPGLDGWYTVSGSHTYRSVQSGSTWWLSISDGTGSGSDYGSLEVALDPARINATPKYLSFRQRERFTSVVAIFTAPNPDARPEDFEVWIDWGDGQRSRGVVTARHDGAFDVSGTVTYRSAGSRPITVTISGEGGPEVADSHVYLERNPVEVTPENGLSITGTEVSGSVGSFIDEDLPLLQPDRFYVHHAALVDWGDGEISWGIIDAAPSGTFTVRGDHRYSYGGDYTVRLVVRQNRITLPTDDVWLYDGVVLGQTRDAGPAEETKEYSGTFNIHIDGPIRPADPPVLPPDPITPEDPETISPVLTGTNRKDTIRVAQEGDELVITGVAGGTQRFAVSQLGHVQIDAMGGNDRIIVSANVLVPVLISGGTGRDTIIGGQGNDTLYGGDGADYLDGGAGAGADWLYGEAGADILIGRANAASAITDGDYFSGGAGRDTLRYFGRATNTIIIDGLANDGPGGHDNVWSDIERLRDNRGTKRLR